MFKSRLWMTTALTLVGASFALLPATGAFAQDSSQAVAGQPAPQDIARPSGGAGASTEAPPAARTAVAGAKDAAGLVSELVVTARKREERLIDVPISVQAFSAAEIKASGITDIQTLQSRAGFTVLSQVSTGAGGRAQGNIVFRGLQGVTFSTPQQNSGSLFVDGIFISGAPESVNTADVERIEVLKGPQNAYFGRSTFGGAVNFITRKPSDTFGGEVNVRATARGTVDGDASVEGPLLPGKVDARLTVFDHNKVAEYHASDGGDLGAEQTRGLSGTLYITPTSHLWFRVRGTYQEDNDSTADQAYIEGVPYGGTSCTGKTFTGTDAAGHPQTFQLTQAYFCNGIPTLNQLGTKIIDANTTIPSNLIIPLSQNVLITSKAQPTSSIRFLNSTPRLTHSGLVRDIVRGSFQGGYRFDSGATIDFNVGYNNSKATYAFDIDHTSANDFFNVFSQIDEDLTSDVRLASNQSSRLRGLIGASYFVSRNVGDRLDDNMAFGSLPSESLFSDTRNQTPSVYGSLEFDIFSFLTATFEGRYESEQDISYNRVGTKYHQSFDSFLPRAILKYHPTSNIDAYVSYAEGAQPATLNAAFLLLNPTQQAYVDKVSPGQSIYSPQPRLRSYEIGLKQKFFDNRIEYSVAAYQMFWDKELTTAFLNNSPACNAAGTQLTPDCPLSLTGSGLLLPNYARLRGVEFEGSAHVTRDFDLSVTLDFKDPIWKSYYNSGLAGFAGGAPPKGVSHFNGNTLGRVPDLQATYTGSYHHQLNDTWTFFARGDALYTGQSWDSDLNLVKTDAFYRVNARVGIERDDLTLELFSTNLFDDKHWDNVSRVADVTAPFTFSRQGVLVQSPDRREFGVRMQYKFH